MGFPKLCRTKVASACVRVLNYCRRCKQMEFPRFLRIRVALNTYEAKRLGCGRPVVNTFEGLSAGVLAPGNYIMDHSALRSGRGMNATNEFYGCDQSACVFYSNHMPHSRSRYFIFINSTVTILIYVIVTIFINRFF